MAELKAPPKDTTPQVKRPGTFGRAPFRGSVQTPGSEGALYGSGDLMAVAVWAVQHIKNKITDHALELAATATGGQHIATFKNHSIENAIDEIGGKLHWEDSASSIPTGLDGAGYD